MRFDSRKHCRLHFLQPHRLEIQVAKFIMALVCLDYYQETTHRLLLCLFHFNQNRLQKFLQTIGYFSLIVHFTHLSSSQSSQI